MTISEPINDVTLFDVAQDTTCQFPAGTKEKPSGFQVQIPTTSKDVSQPTGWKEGICHKRCIISTDDTFLVAVIQNRRKCGLVVLDGTLSVLNQELKLT